MIEAQATLTLSERILKEDSYFSQRHTLSYSGLSKLSSCPSEFYKRYILQERELDTNRNQIEGKLIHCLLLNPEEFDNMFVITPAKLPSPAMVQIVNEVYRLCKVSYDDILQEPTVYRTEFLDKFVEKALHQSLKNDDGRMAKVADEKVVAYWNYLLIAEDRSIIDDEQLATGQAVVEKITANTPFMQILGYYSGFEMRMDRHNEFMMQTLLDDRMFDVRGILDNLVVDHTNKEIRINDIKKTGKDIVSFSKNIDHFRYDLQAAMYYLLVERTFGKTYPGYKIVFRFMVIDNFLQIVPVRVKDTTMALWKQNLQTAFDEVEWHFKKRRFDLPYSVAVNNEILI